MQSDLFPSQTISFSDFWSIWPRKTAKQISEKAWYKLTASNQKKALQDFPKRYRNTPKQFIPHASTYLNQERWEDEIIEPKKEFNPLDDIYNNLEQHYEQTNRNSTSGGQTLLDDGINVVSTVEVIHERSESRAISADTVDKETDRSTGEHRVPGTGLLDNIW